MQSLEMTREEIDLVNDQRQEVAEIMSAAGDFDTPMLAVPGPCSPDLNRMPTGELAAVHHNQRLAVVGERAVSSHVVVRFVGEKPRTNVGYTGIIHEPGGAEAYLQGARQLHRAGVPFASEVMSDAGAVLMVPHLTMGWVGAREVNATGPRYAVRPTDRDRDNGVRPLPVWVKNDQDGGLDLTVNALRTITSDKPQSRTRFGIHGLEEVVTHGNPHVGLILRGQGQRPAGEAVDILVDEIGTARERLDNEFGKDAVPIMVDLSHDHAKYEGGGEEGQLAMAEALGNLLVVTSVSGWMAETYIHSGKQPADGKMPGLSLTDKCIGQDSAEQLIMDMDAARTSGRELLAIQGAVTV